MLIVLSRTRSSILDPSALFCVALIFVACKSKKGSWTSSDKEKARKEVEKFTSSLDILGKNKEMCFDCYINRIEKKYENNDKKIERKK